MIRLLYKPVSVAGGMLAGVIFKRVWKITAGEDAAPAATDARRSWREVLVAAALQGAAFALAKAAIDRGAAEDPQAHWRLARPRRPAFGPGGMSRDLQDVNDQCCTQCVTL